LLDRTTEASPQAAKASASGEATPHPGEPAARPWRNPFSGLPRPFAGLPRHVAQVYSESGLRGLAQRTWQFFVSQSFSSLTRRIVSLNVAGLSPSSSASSTCRNSAPA